MQNAIWSGDAASASDVSSSSSSSSGAARRRRLAAFPAALQTQLEEFVTENGKVPRNYWSQIVTATKADYYNGPVGKTKHSSSFEPHVKPRPRFGHVAAGLTVQYGSGLSGQKGRNRMLVHGGQAGGKILDDLWSLETAVMSHLNYSKVVKDLTTQEETSSLYQGRLNIEGNDCDFQNDDGRCLNWAQIRTETARVKGQCPVGAAKTAKYASCRDSCGLEVCANGGQNWNVSRTGHTGIMLYKDEESMMAAAEFVVFGGNAGADGGGLSNSMTAIEIRNSKELRAEEYWRCPYVTPYDELVRYPGVPQGLQACDTPARKDTLGFPLDENAILATNAAEGSINSGRLSRLSHKCAWDLPTAVNTSMAPFVPYEHITLTFSTFDMGSDADGACESSVKVTEVNTGIVLLDSCGRGLRCPTVQSRGPMRVELYYESTCPADAGIEAAWKKSLADPCATVFCDHGTCMGGVCCCEAGYSGATCEDRCARDAFGGGPRGTTGSAPSGGGGRSGSSSASMASASATSASPSSAQRLSSGQHCDTVPDLARVLPAPRMGHTMTGMWVYSKSVVVHVDTHYVRTPGWGDLTAPQEMIDEAWGDIRTTYPELADTFYNPRDNLGDNGYPIRRTKNLTAEIQSLRCKVTNLPSVAQGRLAPNQRNKFVFRTFQISFMGNTVKDIPTHAQAHTIEEAFARPVDGNPPGLGIDVSVKITGVLKFPFQSGGGCTGSENQDQFRSVSDKYCNPQQYTDIEEDRDCVCTVQNPPTGNEFIAREYEACTLPDSHPYQMDPVTGRQIDSTTPNPLVDMGTNLIEITFNRVPSCQVNASCDFPLIRAAWDTDPRQTVGDENAADPSKSYVQEVRKGRQPYYVVYRYLPEVGLVSTSAIPRAIIQTHDFTTETSTNVTTDGFYTTTAEETRETRNTRTVNVTIENLEVYHTEHEVITWTKSTQVTKGFLGGLVFGGWDGHTPRNDLWLYSYERQLGFRWTPEYNSTAQNRVRRGCVGFHKLGPAAQCKAYTPTFPVPLPVGDPLRVYQQLNVDTGNMVTYNEPVLSCDTTIEYGTAGYCVCDGGVVQRSVGCEHGRFTCKNECNCTATVVKDEELGLFLSRPCPNYDAVQHPDFKDPAHPGRLPTANEWRPLSPLPDPAVLGEVSTAAAATASGATGGTTSGTTSGPSTVSDGLPAARYGHTMVPYGLPPDDMELRPKTARYHMLLFGGRSEDAFLGDLWSLEFPGYTQQEVYVPPPAVYVLDCQANTGYIEMTLNDTVVVVEHNMSVDAFRDQVMSLWFVKNMTLTSVFNQTRVCEFRPPAVVDPNAPPVEELPDPRITFSITEWHQGEAMRLAVPQTTIPLDSNTTFLNVLRTSADGNVTANKSDLVYNFYATRPATLRQDVDTLDVGTPEWVRIHTTPTENQVQATSKATTFPPPRQDHAAVTIHTNAGELMVIYGGWGGNVPFNDVWTFKSGLRGPYGGTGIGSQSVAGPLDAQNQPTTTSVMDYFYQSGIVTFGGTGARRLAEGENDTPYGWWGGGYDPDLFTICLDWDGYCAGPIFQAAASTLQLATTTMGLAVAVAAWVAMGDHGGEWWR